MATHTKPEITLKSINLAKSLSQETPAYTASVFIDGEHFADVENRGCGGADKVYPAKGQVSESDGVLLSPNSRFHQRLADLEERIAATYTEFEPYLRNLEYLCHRAVWDDDDRKRCKRTLARSLVVEEGGKLFTYKGKPTPINIASLTAQLEKQGKGGRVLNPLPFEDVWRIWKEATA